MDDAYENALRTVADAYEAEVARWGGKSLSRVATIVVSSGAFFNRIRAGKTFSVSSLERFATWFRQPTNWPTGSIPANAMVALCSIGRPPIGTDVTHVDHVTRHASPVRRDQNTVLRSGDPL